MKKKIAMLLVMSTLALNMVACGDQPYTKLPARHMS